MNNEFDFETKNGWTHYADAASQEQMDALATRYMDFLSHAKTERETVDLVVEALKGAGFSEDFTKDLVFRTYRGKAVFVARKGKKPLASGVRLISAHTDAPRLDFKQRPLQEQVGIGQAKTHYYGGIRKYQWLARPLALHGVIVKRTARPSRSCWAKTPAIRCSPSLTCCRIWHRRKSPRPWPTPLMRKSST